MKMTPFAIGQTKTDGHPWRFDHPDGRPLQFARLIMRAAEAREDGQRRECAEKKFMRVLLRKRGTRVVRTTTFIQRQNVFRGLLLVFRGQNKAGRPVNTAFRNEKRTVF